MLGGKCLILVLRCGFCVISYLGGVLLKGRDTVKHSKIDKTKVFRTEYRLMQVKSIAECSNGGACCNTLDLHLSDNRS